jgi:hypothetical protein
MYLSQNIVYNDLFNILNLFTYLFISGEYFNRVVLHYNVPYVV